MEINNDNYIADKPVSELIEDRFQRYEFSKRIANTIVQRKSSDSIVFGLFGAWGEGKSSVLNFIERELQNDPSIEIISINPWRYRDEETLLKNLFEKIADVLKIELYTKKEKIGKVITNAAKIGNAFGVDASGIAGLLTDTDIEEFKNRVELSLKSSDKKVVVFVDDIDRLDKREIYALFRLVKLTAEFSNTAYILSFDEQMVAEAIGERYGGGGIKAGNSFLEKIIQVPLKLPKAQPEELKKFCFEVMENIIDFNKLQISNNEMQRFVSQFSSNILIRLITPRLAVRYSNVLSFSMPLLIGEANMVDLMLIEAMKVFYPEHYTFIKNNSEYFIKSYGRGKDHDEGKKKHIIEVFNKLDPTLTSRERYAISRLTGNLFPFVDKIFNGFPGISESVDKWYANKRIVSPDYFDRYYSYTVANGDISDVRFENFIKKFQDENLELVITEIRALLINARVASFLQKLNVRLADFSWKQSKLIINALCNCSELFSDKGNFFLSYGSPRDQSTMFIYQLIEKHKTESAFELSMDTINNAKEFSYAYSINNWLRTGETDEEKIFTSDQYDKMALALKDRAVKESGINSIFEIHSEYIYFLIPIWLEKDKKGLTQYIKKYLTRDKANVLNFLRSTISLRISLTGDNIKYKGDLKKDQYAFIKTIIDVKLLYKMIIKQFPLKELEKENVKWDERKKTNFSDLNMARQFIHWFTQDLKDNTGSI